jgi:hypothetical protein
MGAAFCMRAKRARRAHRERFFRSIGLDAAFQSCAAELQCCIYIVLYIKLYFENSCVGEVGV